MYRTVEAGRTLLVDGPASVSVLSGGVEVFGYRVRSTGRMVVREGKRLPFTVAEKASFDVVLGEGASLDEVEGSTIPSSWAKAFDALREPRRTPMVAMIMGGVDSGKTSLCTYLANRLLAQGQRVAILDGDVGQSDLGPPCTVAYAVVSKPVTDLFGLNAADAFFVGATSPSDAVDRAVLGMARMKEEVLQESVDFVVVNTDGWVVGEDAVAYKSRLAEILAPDVVFCIRHEDELAPLAANMERFRVVAVEAAAPAKQRSREKRKSLRELSYIKYLADAKVKVWPLQRLVVEEPRELCRRPPADDAEREKLKGSLLGLHDAQGRFLGIGVLRDLDCARGALRVLTSVTATPSRIVVGEIRLDESLHEILPQ
ncbi:MAG: Clp1/GlmU family protein [Candidatus Bathyarchaeia archaeon]